MNLFKRGMIFGTFLGSCLALGLLVAALGTRHWITANARRTSNPGESAGKINFGLFKGRKELNVAYGWRSYEMDMVSLLRSDEERLLEAGLWLSTVACLTAGLLLAALAAVFAVLNTAATPARALPGVPGLYLWNFLAMLSDIAATSLWGVQFHRTLQQNVMTKEDLDNMWSSEGMASYGFSFWFVVGAIFVHFANIVIIYIGTREREPGKNATPIVEEKTNGAIMLY